MSQLSAPYLRHSLADRVGEFITLRRDIHAHPELAFEEHRTAARKLTDWGYDVATGLGGTGVVGTLRRGQARRSIGIRADMDALPMAEATGHAWSSQTPGVMHACGHDGHTATLLAAARHIAEQGDFDGLVGSEMCIRDSFPCDAIFALHNMPGASAGHFTFRSGPTMASSDNVIITLQGVGGHGAMPHTTADPLVAAASIVMALQTVVARNVDPLHTAVVTVGALQSGQANNVIPDSASMKLSVRALDPQVRALLKTRIHELVQQQAASFRVHAHIDWQDGYAVLVNDEACTVFASQLATRLFGHARVTPQGAPITASEDFAFMLQRVPGCYFFVGNGALGTPGGCMVHNPGYDFNDDLIADGATFWSALVSDYLPVTAA